MRFLRELGRPAKSTRDSVRCSLLHFDSSDDSLDSDSSDDSIDSDSLDSDSSEED